MKRTFDMKSGYSKNGLPFVKIGNKPKILIDIEGLSFKHEPISGFELKLFMKTRFPLLSEYTIYSIGRKPNLPPGYFMDKMATDIAEMIRDEMVGPVDIMGISTGGQICHYLAADYPELVRKVVIISAAYRLSDSGLKIEHDCAEWFQKGNYGKAAGTLIKNMHSPGLSRSITLLFMPLIAKSFFQGMKYPNDGLVEIEADRQMNFLDRLGDIKAPTLIVSGEKDSFYALDDVKRTAAGISHSELKLYPKYGHNLTISNMKSVIQDIIPFLKQ